MGVPGIKTHLDYQYVNLPDGTMQIRDALSGFSINDHNSIASCGPNVNSEDDLFQPSVAQSQLPRVSHLAKQVHHSVFAADFGSRNNFKS